MELGIDSMSLNPDSVIKTTRLVLDVERRLGRTQNSAPAAHRAGRSRLTATGPTTCDVTSGPAVDRRLHAGRHGVVGPFDLAVSTCVRSDVARVLGSGHADHGPGGVWRRRRLRGRPDASRPSWSRPTALEAADPDLVGRAAADCRVGAERDLVDGVPRGRAYVTRLRTLRPRTRRSGSPSPGPSVWSTSRWTS